MASIVSQSRSVHSSALKVACLLSLVLISLAAPASAFNLTNHAFNKSTVLEISQHWNFTYEEAGVILIDKTGNVTSAEILKIGNRTAVSLSAKEIVSYAISRNATGIKTVHNHNASQICGPSAADLQQWKEIQALAVKNNLTYQGSIVMMKSAYWDENTKSISYYRKPT